MADTTNTANTTPQQPPLLMTDRDRQILVGDRAIDAGYRLVIDQLTALRNAAEDDMDPDYDAKMKKLLKLDDLTPGEMWNATNSMLSVFDLVERYCRRGMYEEN